MNSESVQHARNAVEDKLRRDGAPRPLIDSFLRHYDLLKQGHTGLIDRSMIQPVGPLPRPEDIREYRDAGAAALRESVVIKLNGGLGTSMGLDRAKSLLPVKNGLTFLDIIIRQILEIRNTCRCSIPLIFMNSFSTEQDTRSTLEAYPELAGGQQDVPVTFIQNRVPKIRCDDLRPVDWDADPELEWCPPGHGDLYVSLVTTGILDQLLARGIQYAFVSNADNLGATMDLGMLGYFASESPPIMMEVATRTGADRKGGHLARLKDGRLVLRESAQCPDEEQEEFQDITKYIYFNTNNLWIHLRALQEQLEDEQQAFALPPIFNRKPVDPRNPASPLVHQLESAMGAAISVFDDACAFHTPRTRFVPVKTTDDLLALRSDVYALSSDHRVNPHPARTRAPIVIALDPAYYRMIDDFDARFPWGPPSLIECESLCVEGDMLFGKQIRIRGRAHLRNASSGQVRLPDGMILEGEGSPIEV